jgi:putative addiction module killer protein
MVDGLKDEATRGVILARLDRLAYGHAGDVQPIGQGISDCVSITNPAPRLFPKARHTLVVLLCGGNKRTQAKDIKTAKRLAAEWSE